MRVVSPFSWISNLVEVHALLESYMVRDWFKGKDIFSCPDGFVVKQGLVPLGILKKLSV